MQMVPVTLVTLLQELVIELKFGWITVITDVLVA